MTQGIYIRSRRPKSKKEIKDTVKTNPGEVYIESTSYFENEYSGYVENMPLGVIVFVGPDPYTNRKFYGKIIRSYKGITVV